MREFDVRPSDPSLPYGALSGGNQQKALLAKWFQTEPRLLLLDEPTQGVDVGARQQIFELIRTAAQERGMHVDLRELRLRAARLALRPGDRVRPGRVWRELVGAEVTKERIIEQCYAAMAGRGEPGSSRDRRRGAGVRRRAARSRLADLAERYALLVAWGVTCVVFGILRPDTFLTTSNFTTIFGSQAVLVVLTLALLVPLTAGDYDLSVAATMGLSAMMLAILNVEPRLVDRRVDPRGARRRARRRPGQRRARRADRHRLADRDARQLDVHRRA